MISYFEGGGARRIAGNENPAEWMLEVLSDPTKSWNEYWISSLHHSTLESHIQALKEKLVSRHTSSPALTTGSSSNTPDYASGFFTQLRLLTYRTFTHSLRTPTYLPSRLLLVLSSALLNSLSFLRSPSSIQGTQNQIFSIFLVFVVHSNLIQIYLPYFLSLRTLFEKRENGARMYGWAVFVLANVAAEVPWWTVLGAVQWGAWYWPLGLFGKEFRGQGTRGERAVLEFLGNWVFMLVSGTLSVLVGTFAPDAATGVNVSALLWSLSLMFCGYVVISFFSPTLSDLFSSSLHSRFLGSVSTGCTGFDVLIILQCSHCPNRPPKILYFYPPRYAHNILYEDPVIRWSLFLTYIVLGT